MERVVKNGECTLKDFEQGVILELDQNPRNLECDFSDEEFDNEDYTLFKDGLVDVDGKSKPRFLGGSRTPFHVLKENMKPLTEDGLVLKNIIKRGIGPPIPDKSVVMMHYEAFLEGKREPFDSTRLRNKPYKFLIGSGDVLPGFEIGVRSMIKEEISSIIISPEYAYGEMGCPPRIPASAEILYEIEIINFHISKDAIEFEEMNPDEQKQAPFEKIVGVYYCENQMAKDLFRQERYGAAIARYKKAVNLLEDVSAKNEEQDEKRKQYLTKLYTNLSLCFINSQKPKQGVTYADKALKFYPEDKKGLCRMGQSLHKLSDYEGADHYLNKAKNLYPYDRSIDKLILNLEKNRMRYQDWELAFCKNAMGMSLSEDVGDKKIALEESPEFISTIRDELKGFMEKDEKELVFSPGYTESQLEVVKALAQEFNLAFVSKIHFGKKINKVTKRKVNT